MLNSPPSLPLISEYLVLAFGDPNSSLSMTFILMTSTPTAFSGTDVDIWGGKNQDTLLNAASYETYFKIRMKYFWHL